MARPLITLAATLLIIGAGPVFADSSTDLGVTGVITPGACTPALSQGGHLPVINLLSDRD